MGKEIERKYLFDALPAQPAIDCLMIEQGYLSTDPVIRVRCRVCEATGEAGYILTVKGRGLAEHTESEWALTETQYRNLLTMCGQRIVRKKRYLYPLEGTELIVEADVFEGGQAGLRMAEVEFPDRETMLGFEKPSWLGDDVTEDESYYNAAMALKNEKRNRE